MGINKNSLDNLGTYPNDFLITVYELGYHRLSKSLTGLTEAEMKSYLIPGKWNIFEIAIHVVHAEIMAACRIRQTITQSDRNFPFYNQDIWTTKLITESNPDMADIFEHLDLFKSLRITTAQIFKKATKADWTKTGFHPENGKDISLRELLEIYADHSERHIKQILERRMLLGKSVDLGNLFEIA